MLPHLFLLTPTTHSHSSIIFFLILSPPHYSSLSLCRLSDSVFFSSIVLKWKREEDGSDGKKAKGRKGKERKYGGRKEKKVKRREGTCSKSVTEDKSGEKEIKEGGLQGAYDTKTKD